MKTINTNQLSNITGGATVYASRDNSPMSAALAAVTQSAVNYKPNRASVSMLTQIGDVAIQQCASKRHQRITPENGDRNALGQVYSWGTWWDDTH